MGRDELPIRDPTALPDERPRSNASVHGVLLAAGASSRYGAENKLLATVDGEPLVRHAVKSLLKSTVGGVTVVVGHDHDRVTDGFADLDVAVRVNGAYGDGQSTSVRLGVRDAAERDADAVLIALGDMPSVSPTTHDLLVDAYERGTADIVAAAYEGRRGNPVLFDDGFFEPLTDVRGDIGGRELIAESGAAIAVETGDPGVFHDVDRPSDVDDGR